MGVSVFLDPNLESEPQGVSKRIEIRLPSGRIHNSSTLSRTHQSLVPLPPLDAVLVNVSVADAGLRPDLGG